MPLLHIVDLTQFLDIINTSQSPVIVDFYASWCGPCKAIAPSFEKCANMEECSNLLFVKVNVDDAPEISEYCQVSAMPTFRAYFKGEKLTEFKGASLQKLEDMVNHCLAVE